MDAEAQAETAARSVAPAIPGQRGRGEEVVIVTSATHVASEIEAVVEPGPSLPADPNKPVAGQTIAAVERAIDVLLLFGEPGRTDLGVTEISGELSLSKAAVHRILSSLRSRDLVTLDRISHRYSLGPSSLSLGRAYLARLDVRSIAAPELAALSTLIQETAILSVRSGDHHMYVEQVLPHREVRLVTPIGSTVPLHAGSCAKAFLAFLSEDEIDAYLARPSLAALTPTTITDPDALRAELVTVRAQGYAASNGERQSGAASIAAPVFDHTGQPTAVIGLAGPAERFGDSQAEAIEALLEVTNRLSLHMGWSPTSPD